MITKIILETISFCNRTNNKFLGKFNSFRVGNGNFENSKLFEGLVILNKKKNKTSQTEKKKVHRIIGSFFSTFRHAAHALDHLCAGHCAQSVSLVRHGRQQVRTPRTRSLKKALRR